MVESFITRLPSVRVAHEVTVNDKSEIANRVRFIDEMIAIKESRLSELRFLRSLMRSEEHICLAVVELEFILCNPQLGFGNASDDIDENPLRKEM